MTGSDLIVLAPWLVFGAAVGAICARLLAGRSRARRRRAPRHQEELPGTSRDSGGGDPSDPGSAARGRVPSRGRPGAAA